MRAAGIISIDLARQMLQLLPNTYVLVVSTENVTQNWYFGNTKSMLIPNCLFRVGGAAMLLSNKRSEGWWVVAEYVYMWPWLGCPCMLMCEHTADTHCACNRVSFWVSCMW